MSDIYVWPYGHDHAHCTPLVLRPSETHRLVFHPQIVNNKEDSSEPVLGTFVYQRRKKGEEWESEVSVRISDLAPGVKLALSPWETHQVANVVRRLHAFYKKNGLPKTKCRIDLAGPLPDDDLTEDVTDLLQRVIETSGNDGLVSLLRWAADAADIRDVAGHLSRLKAIDLQKINTIAGLGMLKKVLSLWKRNKGSQKEDFWQATLRKYPFVLSQVFAAPVVSIQGRMYVGGKGVQDTGGKYPDFILQNSITQNTLLIEIKEPTTKLLGKPYRKPDIYNVSADLSGAVMQVSKYREEFLKDFWPLQGRSKRDGVDLVATNPPCLVIIGTRAELDSDYKIESFESFRCGLRDVQVITFDELFEKTRTLVALIEGKVTPSTAE